MIKSQMMNNIITETMMKFYVADEIYKPIENQVPKK